MFSGFTGSFDGCLLLAMRHRCELYRLRVGNCLIVLSLEGSRQPETAFYSRFSHLSDVIDMIFVIRKVSNSIS